MRAHEHDRLQIAGRVRPQEGPQAQPCLIQISELGQARGRRRARGLDARQRIDRRHDERGAVLTQERRELFVVDEIGLAHAGVEHEIPDERARDADGFVGAPCDRDRLGHPFDRVDRSARKGAEQDRRQPARTRPREYPRRASPARRKSDGHDGEAPDHRDDDGRGRVPRRHVHEQRVGAPQQHASHDQQRACSDGCELHQAVGTWPVPSAVDAPARSRALSDGARQQHRQGRQERQDVTRLLANRDREERERQRGPDHEPASRGCRRSLAG